MKKTNGTAQWCCNTPAYTPSSAVNGVISQDNGNDLTHTQNSVVYGDQYWIVDLLGAFNVTTVVIFNRVDCCANRMSGATLLSMNAAGTVLSSATLTGDYVQTVPLAIVPLTFTSTPSATSTAMSTASMSMGASATPSPSASVAASSTASPSVTPSLTMTQQPPTPMSLTLTAACLNFYEVWVFAPSGAGVSLAPGAAASITSVYGGDSATYGPAAGIDNLATNPWSVGVNPFVNSGCPGTLANDVWTLTFPAPSAIGRVYVVNRRDTSCSGDCGQRTVGATLAVLAGNGTTLVSTTLSGLWTVYNLNFTGIPGVGYGAVAPVKPAPGDPWQSSAAALATGIRYIKVICAVGSFLHMHEVSFLCS